MAYKNTKEYFFYVYIMSNYEKTTFYIGFCNHLVRRIIEHKNGFGSYFTTKYKLTNLIFYEEYGYVCDAINREKEIKKWRREKKLALIKSMNPELKDISSELFKDYGINNNEILIIVNELKERYNLKTQ